MLTPLRFSSAGHWHENHTTGALLLDPAVSAEQAVRARLVATVLKVRASKVEGLVNTADLVADNDRLWLLTEQQISPCVADLLPAADPAVDGWCAVAILLDAGRALCALHDAGLTHGTVAPDAIVVDPTGRSRLAEVGIVAAIWDRASLPADDVHAWAATARVLGSTLARSQDGLAQLIVHAAARADAVGLAEAISQLGGAVPEAKLVQARSALATTAKAFKVRPADQPALTTVRLLPMPPSNPQATSLGQRRSAVGGSAAAVDNGESPSDAQPAAGETYAASGTLLGKRAPNRRSGGQRSSAPTAARESGTTRSKGISAPESGRVAVPADLTAQVAEQRTKGARQRRRRRRMRSALLTLLVVAGVLGWLIWRSGVVLSVGRVAVRPSTVRASCNTTVDLTATVHATGTGRLTYQWIRGGGDPSGVFTRSIWPGQGVVHLHLDWEFSGRGSYAARVLFRVLSPRPDSESTSFTYACR